MLNVVFNVLIGQWLGRKVSDHAAAPIVGAAVGLGVAVLAMVKPKKSEVEISADNRGIRISRNRGVIIDVDSEPVEG